MSKADKGRIVIISSPSGGGKTSICRKLLSPARRKQGWRFSISYTTRQPRANERSGREYHFVSDQQFTALKNKGAFAEDCRVHLYRYGTPRAPLQQTLAKGGVMILDVDVQGARKLTKEYPQAITVFVLPPSKRELHRRLSRRGTETAAQLAVRRENARKEMKLYRRFEYTVINDNLTDAVKRVLAVIEAHPCRTENIPREQIENIIG
jgi:guanylate kinase